MFSFNYRWIVFCIHPCLPSQSFWDLKLAQFPTSQNYFQLKSHLFSIYYIEKSLPSEILQSRSSSWNWQTTYKGPEGGMWMWAGQAPGQGSANYRPQAESICPVFVQLFKNYEWFLNFLMVEGKSKEEIFWHFKITWIQISVAINKALWNTVTPVHLHTVYGCCFCGTAAELRSCNRHYMACKPKVSTIWSFKEKGLPTSALLRLNDQLLFQFRF